MIAAWGVGQDLFDLLPLRIVPALIMGSLIYFMCGLQWKPALFLHFLLIILLFNCVTALVCMTISTVIRQSNSLANLVAIVTLIFFTLFQGAMINFGAAGAPHQPDAHGISCGTSGTTHRSWFFLAFLLLSGPQTRCPCGSAGSPSSRRSALHSTR